MSKVHKTDGWAYLNVMNPLCAWATYRGVLVSVPAEPGFMSVWSAGMLKKEDEARTARELALEQHRASLFPDRVSRLKGMYCFSDIKSAERALAWGSHFKQENLAELSFADVQKGERLDSNWIFNYDPKANGHSAAAFDSYWKGEQFPDADPVWEFLVEGRLTVLGKALRERAYEQVKKRMPEATAILELARSAAQVGSDLGSVSAFLLDEGEYVRLTYVLDMRDAHDHAFLKRLRESLAGGNAMRADAVKAFSDDVVKVPDLRAFEFRKLKSEMPRL